MESSPPGRCGEIASDMSIIFVTAAQLIFFTRFHRYIAWVTTEPDGSVARLSLLTDDYFTWLVFPTVASIVVIIASTIMILYDNHWFRQIAWIIFCLMGFAVTVSLVAIFPFDFSVIPNATTADVAPKVVRGFFILMAVFYGVCALVLTTRLRSYAANQQTR
jgi:hypothetical protein